ncbi:unnamed protein product [Enterobius vermicularis]|uniref:Uncharacterized protein n=1 Tax=Enterobius vermicularis TaxID=51028 RepID=A0A0N4VH32_ENTVE|nr:unnamed protein product [Enterobius vermicularis]
MDYENSRRSQFSGTNSFRLRKPWKASCIPSAVIAAAPLMTAPLRDEVGVHMNWENEFSEIFLILLSSKPKL